MPTEPQIDRMTSADISAVLERLAGSDLAARGAVNVISLEAIKAKAGPRWDRSRDGVWAYAQKRLDEQLGRQDIAQRINDTDFLVALTNEAGAAAQAVALNILEDVLTHFLGEANPAHLKISTVTAITGERLTAAPLDPKTIAVARRQAASPDPVRHGGVDPAEEQRRNPASFVTASGMKLRIDFALEPITSLRHAVTAALRIEPTVTEELTGRQIPVRAFGRLSDDELALIDQATIHYGALFLPGADQRTRIPLILPTSFRTMMARKGRGLLIAAAGAAPDLVKTAVMVELVDVDRGTPAGRLIEVAGLLRGLTRGVFARAVPGREALEPLRGARLAGITLDAGDLAPDASKLAAQMLDFGRQAKGLAGALLVQGLASEDFFAVAEVAGVTHASVRGASLTAGRNAA